MSTFLLAPVLAAFALYGEDFILQRSGVNLPHRGLFGPLDGATTTIYFDANETVGLLRPAQVLYMAAPADPAVSGDVYMRDGRLWTVRKTYFFRFSGVVIVQLCLCD